MFAFLVVLLGVTCSGLKPVLHNASVQKPSNVALYFSVQTRDGKPVPDLTAESFRIYEDDNLISPYESKQTILNPELSVVHYIVLLLDMSGSITDSGSLPTLITEATEFAERTARSHQVAVYGFDGGTDLIPAVRFTTSGPAVENGVNALARWKVRDPSTNLNGAVVEAIAVLEKQLASATQPLRFGTLVVFTDGTDRAHRVSENEMYQVLNKSEVNVFAIAVGGEIDDAQLARLGRTGIVKTTDMTDVGAAFEQVSEQIEAEGRKFYLLSCCSPSRANVHTLRIEVEANGQTGSLEHQFDAAGFAPRCDPNTRPNFPIGRIRLK